MVDPLLSLHLHPTIPLRRDYLVILSYGRIMQGYQ